MRGYEPRRILVTGGRDWEDYETVKNVLSNHVNNINGDIVVIGGCPTGADAMAELVCMTYDINMEKYSAQWDEHGRAAGPIRNQLMVDKGADVCLVFDTGGRGTRDCHRRAKMAGIPTYVYREGEN